MADHDVEVENSSWARTAKDLTSGAAGGIAQVLLGMVQSCYFIFVLEF